LGENKELKWSMKKPEKVLSIRVELEVMIWGQRKWIGVVVVLSLLRVVSTDD
jgi:hypothetical protein